MKVQSQFIEMFGSVDNNPKSYDIKKVGDFAECFAGATPVRRFRLTGIKVMFLG